MSDFNARADVYITKVNSAGGYRPLLPPKPIRSGTITDTVKWIMAKDELDRQMYFMTVPLEAGFIKSELSYQDIEAISRRPDFPK
jgi:hypothetical protein